MFDNNKTATNDTRLKRLLSLLAVPGGPGDEAEVASFISGELTKCGLAEDAVRSDRAHRKIGSGGRGNLFVKLAGRGLRGPRRMLSAHMDTVPLCVGNRPVVNGDWITGADSAKALGGDDRSGCAVLLNTLCEVLQSDVPHPPLTFLWTVQEEVGLRGAKHVSASSLGKPKLGFNFDGRSPETMVIGATGDVGIDMTIRGLASHAGVCPEAGVNAAIVFAKAIADLEANGWHGQIAKGRQSGTSNVGVLSGGAATNVVMDELCIRAEVRSHSTKFRERIIAAWKSAFEKAAKSTKNVDGVSAEVGFSSELKYESFALPKTSEVVKTATQAVKAIGLQPEYVIGNGGLDANWLTANGIPTATFGCGQHGIHTVSEKLHVPSFLKACDLAWVLATDEDS